MKQNKKPIPAKPMRFKMPFQLSLEQVEQIPSYVKGSFDCHVRATEQRNIFFPDTLRVQYTFELEGLFEQ